MQRRRRFFESGPATGRRKRSPSAEARMGRARDGGGGGGRGCIRKCFGFRMYVGMILLHLVCVFGLDF